MSRQDATFPTRGGLLRIGHLGSKESAAEMINRVYDEGVQRRAERLAHMPYRAYLQTEEWQALRREKLVRSGYECARCERRGVLLDVHHLTYERRGREHLEDLVVLCRDCHRYEHSRGKV